jgi:hypothetical protein
MLHAMGDTPSGGCENLRVSSELYYIEILDLGSARSCVYALPWVMRDCRGGVT